MPSQFSPEELRTEIDILKMKMMLEYGAEFHTMPGMPPLDPALEHQFLTQVRDIEINRKNAREITIWEKIGSPRHFPLVNKVYEGQLAEYTFKLQDLLMKHGIHFTVLSPNITPREIYRFMTEELLQVKIPDQISPGIYCFVYDEFHPDPYYENEQTAMEQCMGLILSDTRDLMLMPLCKTVKLNDQLMSEEECRRRIIQYKQRFTSITNGKLESKKTYVCGTSCVVKGYQETGLSTTNHCLITRGAWQVDFITSEHDCWEISAIQVEGFHF